jgi:hypothetical protein
MKINRTFRLVILSVQFAALFFMASQGNADPDVVGRLNPALLASPVPVCFVKTPLAEALKSLEKELRAKKFEVSAPLGHNGEFLATQFQDRGSQDRFLVWLGRDLDDCNRINVFVQYARFMPILGQGLKRVVIDENDEQEHVAEFVKSSLGKVFSCQWYNGLEPSPL